MGLFIIGCVEHVVNSVKETHDFSSENFYFCVISLNIASPVFSPFSSLWNSDYLDAGYPRYTLQFSYLSSLQSGYLLVLLSESSPHVPNVVLFNMFFGLLMLLFKNPILFLV